MYATVFLWYARLMRYLRNSISQICIQVLRDIYLLLYVPKGGLESEPTLFGAPQPISKLKSKPRAFVCANLCRLSLHLYSVPFKIIPDFHGRCKGHATINVRISNLQKRFSFVFRLCWFVLFSHLFVFSLFQSYIRFSQGGAEGMPKFMFEPGEKELDYALFMVTSAVHSFVGAQSLF